MRNELVPAVLLLLTIGAPGCATVALERHVVVSTPDSGDPIADLQAIVRGAVRAQFFLVERREPYYLVVRRCHGRRFIEVGLRYAPGYIEVELLRSRGFRATGGRIHRRYYDLLEELQAAVRIELSAGIAGGWSTGDHVPVDMSASTTRVEATATGTVTTTRTATLSTLVPSGETRHSVSAEGPPIATSVEAVPPNPFVAGDKP